MKLPSYTSFRHRLGLVMAACLLALLVPASPALAQQKKPTEPQPQPCGDLGADNRPNICSKLVEGHWHTQTSKCTKLGPESFRYTHCNGTTQEIKGGQACCMVSSECKGAGYVGTCLSK